MHLIDSNGLENVLSDKYVFLDNDFLEKLFKDTEFLPEFITLASKGYLIIDPFTRFEFFKDIYHPEQLDIRESFLNQEIFYPVINRNETFIEIQENALILSQIYECKKQGCGKSTLDLFLAGRVMVSEQHLLITGNRVHFPPCIFDVLGVMNIEDSNSGNIRAYSIIKFNREKFEKCMKDLEKIKTKLKNPE